jgi:hypothetical protein
MCRSKFVLQLVTVQPQSRSSWVERCECPLCVFLSSIYQCPPPGCTHGSNQTNNQLPLPHRSVTLSSVLQGPERTRLIVKCYGRSTTMRRSPKNDDHGQNIWCTFPRRFKFAGHRTLATTDSLHEGLVLTIPHLLMTFMDYVRYGHQF